MAKISSSELHRNDESSSAFAVCILTLRDWVRMHVAFLAKSRRADEQAPGSIHALRKLCDGEDEMWQVRSYLHRTEVEEWRDIFFAWLKRVNRWIPEHLREDLRLNAEEDFEVLLDLAGNAQEHSWRKESLERSIKISFDSEQALQEAKNRADEKHPVQLGSSLHEYIYSAIRDLNGMKSRPADVKMVSAPRPLISIDRDDAGAYTIIIEDFSLLQDHELVEQGVDLTAYDIEECILGLSKTSSISPSDFDCESSAFVFRSTSCKAVCEIVGLFYKLLEDTELRDAQLHKKA